MKLDETSGSESHGVFEEDVKYPINNETNQIATGKDKTMIDELNVLLRQISDSAATYSQKASLEPKILDFFSKAKCSILDKAIMKSAGVGDPNKAGKPYANAQDWISEVVMLSGSTNDDGAVWNVKYDFGVMYFSLDDQGKINNAVVG
jgi:hypothetical protein